jgi:hypothetical protein
MTSVQSPSSQTLRTLPTKTVFGHNYESINANCTHFLPALPTAPMSAFGVDTLVCLRTNPTFSMALPSTKDHLLKPFARSLRRPSLDIITKVSTPTAPIFSPLCPRHPCQHLELIPSFAYAQTPRFQWHTFPPKTVFSNLPHIAYEDRLWT